MQYKELHFVQLLMSLRQNYKYEGKSNTQKTQQKIKTKHKYRE